MKNSLGKGNLKRRLCILCAAVLFIFCGCAGNSPGGTESVQPEQAEHSGQSGQEGQLEDSGQTAQNSGSGQSAAMEDLQETLPDLKSAAGRITRNAWGVGSTEEDRANDDSLKDWEMQVTEEEIKIPGVSGAYDILFLTDTHVVIKDENDSEQVRPYRGTRHKQFHNEEGVSASEQFEDWINYANEQEVDAVFFGGDIIDYPSEGNLEFLEAQLERLEMPYLYTLGNHDWTFPWEYMTEKGGDAYLPLLEPYMSGDTVLHTWETEDLLVIAVDDSSGQINEEALEEYKELLKMKKPVILLVHVPFLTQSVLTEAKNVWPTAVVLGGGNYGGIYPNEYSEEFIELTTAKDSPVELVLAGHVHFYDKDYIVGDREVLQLVGDAGFHGSALRLHITGN